MHVLRNESWRQGGSSRMPVDLGVHFGEGLFRLVESRETSEDPPRRLSVQQDVGRVEGATDRRSRMRAGRYVAVSLSCCSTPSGAGP
jgi:hypothetical protein